jgi:glycerol uptake facilitator-like aquaporin
VIQIVGDQKKGRYVPFAVAGWIGAAYFFTSSTSFANPAVTFARSFTDTFAGIQLGSVPAFIAAQLIGAGAGLLVARALKNDK